MRDTHPIHSPLDRVADTMAAASGAILEVVSSLPWPRVGEAIQAIVDCPGKVAVTGMGKIGYVGARFAMTLASTGTPAFFLHPGEARHGDLGMVGKEDLLIALSNSGQTREVIEAITQAQSLHSMLDVITISGRPMTLPVWAGGYAEPITLEYGEIIEACPLGLTPTTSLTVVGVLLDGIALAVCEQKGFTREDYAARHHGGYLGEQARKGRI